MKNNKLNILLGVGVLALIGGIVFSQRKPKKGSNNADGSEDCGCNNASGDADADPYMMLEVNQQEFPNFSGNKDMLLAKNNYPFGQYFANNPALTVSSMPIRRRNKGTYKWR